MRTMIKHNSKWYKQAISLLLCVCIMASGMAIVKAQAAAEVRVGYLINNANQTVYAEKTMTKKIGTMYGSDEGTISEVTNKTVRVKYPVKGGTKSGYIPRSAVLVDTSTTQKKAMANMTAYKRPSTKEKFGEIYKNDKVFVVGSKSRNGFVQVRYPVGSNKYKYAWITTANAQKYLSSASTFSSQGRGSTGSNSGTIALAKPVSLKGAKWSTSRDSAGFQHDVQASNISGTPVYAIESGTVKCQQIHARYSGKNYLVSYGNKIQFTSSNKRVTATYAHLKGFARSYSGQISSSNTKRVSASNVPKASNLTTTTLKTYTVKKGDLIGYVGATGNATGPHLHFELKIDGKRVNPPAYVKIN